MTAYNSRKMRAALRADGRGWSVLPLHWVEDGTCSCAKSDCTSSGKHPLTSHGVNDATFEMQEGEFEVEVINAHGGQTMRNQSTGEKKMAAIIASFALRSIAPPCNLLVLDEPGDGLDAVNAKAFAVGLKKLRGELGTVLLTSHNPVVVGELSGENCIQIEKHGGVSSLVG